MIPSAKKVARERRKSSSGYMPTLDGWRAVAILLVIASHDRLYHVAGVPLSWLHWTAGGYGVGLFFALSGLLICSRLLQEESVRGRIDLKGFYIRRVCRIQPAALVYLAAVCVLIQAGMINRTYSGVLSALFFTRNYLPAAHTGDVWYTAHFWSLAIEEHFYFFMPALLAFIPRARIAALGILLLLTEGLHHLLGARLESPHTDLEGGMILLGALAAVLLTRADVRALCVRWLRPWAVLPAVCAVWIVLSVHNSGYNHTLFIVSLPPLIVSTMLHAGGFWGRILETGVLKFIGRISYSLYLWQQMFFTFVENSKPASHNNLLNSVQHSPLRYALLLALATASYYWIEKPLIRVGHRLATPATPGREDLNEPDGSVPSRTALDAS